MVKMVVWQNDWTYMFQLSGMFVYYLPIENMYFEHYKHFQWVNNVLLIKCVGECKMYPRNL